MSVPLLGVKRKISKEFSLSKISVLLYILSIKLSKPSGIDYVLAETKQDQVYYAGHSMGCTQVSPEGWSSELKIHLNKYETHVFYHAIQVRYI